MHPRHFKTWFWRPPRPHGDTIVDRRVSPLELLYDLVYVAVISQAGLDVAEHVSLIRVARFAVVFSLTWIAWTNGSLYLELHGRSDGRTRTYVFLQMGILAILAVFARGAGNEAGPAFALTYSAFLAVMTWLWYTVRRQDVTERHDLADETGRYVVAMAVSAALMAASASFSSALRLIVWAVLVVGWVVVLLLMGRSRVGLSRGMTPTDSLVERFGTFVIIVLGEVIFGVVEGLSLANRDLETMVTGMIALVVGLGFWWIYFDLVSQRSPTSTRTPRPSCSPTRTSSRPCRAGADPRYGMKRSFTLAITWNSSAVRCEVVPLPWVAQVSLPGLALA